ncbi:MAG: hypothetical protein V1787_03930 [Candidatus Micrarchaeota archaeon]
MNKLLKKYWHWIELLGVLAAIGLLVIGILGYLSDQEQKNIQQKGYTLEEAKAAISFSENLFTQWKDCCQNHSSSCSSELSSQNCTIFLTRLDKQIQDMKKQMSVGDYNGVIRSRNAVSAFVPSQSLPFMAGPDYTILIIVIIVFAVGFYYYFFQHPK